MPILQQILLIVNQNKEHQNAPLQRQFDGAFVKNTSSLPAKPQETGMKSRRFQHHEWQWLA